MPVESRLVRGVQGILLGFSGCHLRQRCQRVHVKFYRQRAVSTSRPLAALRERKFDAVEESSIPFDLKNKRAKTKSTKAERSKARAAKALAKKRDKVEKTDSNWHAAIEITTPSHVSSHAREAVVSSESARDSAASSLAAPEAGKPGPKEQNPRRTRAQRRKAAAIAKAKRGPNRRERRREEQKALKPIRKARKAERLARKAANKAAKNAAKSAIVDDEVKVESILGLIENMPGSNPVVQERQPSKVVAQANDTTQERGKRSYMKDKASSTGAAQDKRGKAKKEIEDTNQRPTFSNTQREGWQIQKSALQKKFGDQSWQPSKRLSPDTIDGIRALHKSDPDKFTTEVIAKNFAITPEAIRRILKSKWRPNEEEVVERQVRWERRGVRKWQEMVDKEGMRPPAKWRALGVRSPETTPEGKPIWTKKNPDAPNREEAGEGKRRRRRTKNSTSPQEHVPWADVVRNTREATTDHVEDRVGSRIL